MIRTLKLLIKDNLIISKILKLGKKSDLKSIFKKADLNKNSRVIFDVGANVGSVTLDFLKYFPKSIIWAFEPFPKTFEILKWNIRRYKERVNLNKLGFFNENTKKELNITTYHPAHSLIPLHKDFKNSFHFIQEVRTQEISVMKLDDFVKKNNIKHINIIKIDVEGVEYEVLEGGQDTLKNKVDSIIIEISLIRKGRKSDNLIRVFDFLYKTGFYLFDIYNLTKKTHGNTEILNEFDCIFKKM
ncbi:MAG: FkbM family methyltransferase [Candidatus Helarchaeota archaeon]|nr:FkbM family methyltransferase [Candidatus Helarchaeota archaeon]